MTKQVREVVIWLLHEQLGHPGELECEVQLVNILDRDDKHFFL